MVSRKQTVTLIIASPLCRSRIARPGGHEQQLSFTRHNRYGSHADQTDVPDIFSTEKENLTKKRKSKRKRSLLNSASSPTLLRTKENQRAIQRKVREMAASGLVEDQIALRIGTDKNQLRRRYIDQIKDGRANAAAEAQSAAGEELSADEETMRRALYAGFGNPDYMIGDLNILQNATLEQTNAVWNEWLRRARGGARTTPLIIENELFPNKT